MDYNTKNITLQYFFIKKLDILTTTRYYDIAKQYKKDEERSESMSEKEKQTLDEISKAVSGMTEAEKARFLGIAEGMSIMKDMSQKNLADQKAG